MADAKRKASKGVIPKKGGRRPGGPGGNARDQHVVQDMTAQVSYLLDRHQGKHAIAAALGKWLFQHGHKENDEPLPLGTTVDYIRRATERNAEESEVKRADARRRQVRRLFGDRMRAETEKRWRDVNRIENLLAKILGTETAKAIEITGAEGGPVAVKTVLTSDEKRARAAELAAIAAARIAAAQGDGKAAD